MSIFNGLHPKFVGSPLNQQDNNLPVEAPPKSIFDGLKLKGVEKERDEPKKESSGIASLAKGAISGALGSLPDLASAIYNIPAKVINYARENPEQYAGTEFAPMSQNQAELPMIPSATEGIEKGIENVIGETPETYKHLVEGSKVAGSLATPGGLAKGALKVGAKGVSKGLGYIGSLKPSTLTGGALAGTTMSNLEEDGYSPLTQIGAGIASGSIPSITGSLSTGILKGGKNTALWASGLSSKKLNLKSAQAAKESGIELPSSAFTDAKSMSLADQFIGKTPYFGDKLRNKYLKGEKQTLDRLNNIYDEVGPLKTQDIENKINDLYKKANKALPENASIPPTHTIDTIDEILSKLNRSLSPSEDQAYVIKKLKDIKEGLTKNSKNIPNDLSTEELKWLKKNGFEDLSKLGKVKNEFPIIDLWETKKSLNDTINWNVKDNNYKDLLKKVQGSILEDIGQYGKKDPVWYDTFKSADELFGKVAKRKRLEHLLSEKPINPATGNYSYNSLSKMIHSPQTSREIKNLTSPSTFEKIEKLGHVARTMAIKSANIPNPSGTSMVSGIGGLLTGLFYAPLETLTIIGGISGVTKLLTDQRFLDLAIRTAQGTKNSKDVLNMRRKVKELTGISINSINRKLYSQEENKDIPKK